ncbi:Aflatoxin B1 aldehyde reductase member 2 [Cladophialophora carrionii]|uniref:Aflatoxin B1 aldehyde reductase member 2 n=1 Tax=Cladophialophora carrionii TaxID=86049 RepID=A0A1C1CDM6_9EURO|nr:Aflatoxin B1 aldehyde reductase member 2 [Cladophialophora carrionii]
MPLVTSSMGTQKPRVILGLMTFGPPGTESKGGRITTLDEYNKNLDFFQSRGYNEVDTARAYIGGDQEAFTREAKWKDRGLTLATKCYPVNPGDHAPEKLRASLEKSLKELGTETVDIFYLHAPDRSVPFKDTLEECDKMFKEGKFVQLGLSNFAAWEVAEVWNIANERGWVKPTIYQAMYNAITRDIEKELVPACRKYGIDLVVYNPLAGGVFSGKYKSKSEVPSEGRFADLHRAGKMYRDRYFHDNTFLALQHIEPVVQKNGLTLLETALRWCVHHSMLKFAKDGGNDGVIIGVSSLQQLEGNLADLEKGPLPDEVVKVLDEAWEVYLKGRGPTYWR